MCVVRRMLAPSPRPDSVLSRFEQSGQLGLFFTEQPKQRLSSCPVRLGGEQLAIVFDVQFGDELVHAPDRFGRSCPKKRF